MPDLDLDELERAGRTGQERRLHPLCRYDRALINAAPELIRLARIGQEWEDAWGDTPVGKPITDFRKNPHTVEVDPTVVDAHIAAKAANDTRDDG